MEYECYDCQHRWSEYKAQSATSFHIRCDKCGSLSVKRLTLQKLPKGAKVLKQSFPNKN